MRLLQPFLAPSLQAAGKWVVNDGCALQ